MRINILTALIPKLISTVKVKNTENKLDSPKNVKVKTMKTTQPFKNKFKKYTNIELLKLSLYCQNDIFETHFNQSKIYFEKLFGIKEEISEKIINKEKQKHILNTFINQFDENSVNFIDIKTVRLILTNLVNLSCLNDLNEFIKKEQVEINWKIFLNSEIVQNYLTKEEQADISISNDKNNFEEIINRLKTGSNFKNAYFKPIFEKIYIDFKNEIFDLVENSLFIENEDNSPFQYDLIKNFIIPIILKDEKLELIAKIILDRNLDIPRKILLSELSILLMNNDEKLNKNLIINQIDNENFKKEISIFLKDLEKGYGKKEYIEEAVCFLLNGDLTDDFHENKPFYVKMISVIFTIKKFIDSQKPIE